MVSETKLDDNFPVSQFLVDGYTPLFRLDCDNNGYNYDNNGRHNGLFERISRVNFCLYKIIPWKVLCRS